MKSIIISVATMAALWASPSFGAKCNASITYKIAAGAATHRLVETAIRVKGSGPLGWRGISNYGTLPINGTQSFSNRTELVQKCNLRREIKIKVQCAGDKPRVQRCAQSGFKGKGVMDFGTISIANCSNLPICGRTGDGWTP